MFRRYLLISLLIPTTMVGCATPNTLSRTILEDNYNAVRLETRLDASRKPVPLGFEQPAQIGEEEMTRLLQSVQIVEPPGFLSALILKSKPEPEPAFTSKEAESLAKPLAAALRTATPDERVIFFFHHQRSVYKGTTTSGVAFVKDKRLQIILGRYQQGTQPGKPDILIGGDPFPDSNSQDFYVQPGPFQSLVEETQAPGIRGSVVPKRWLSIDYASLLTAPPPAATPAVSPSTAPAAAPMLEEKLRTLNKLKEDGLITEEEYTEKRKELLKSF